jgi:hypothetical protein
LAFWLAIHTNNTELTKYIINLKDWKTVREKEKDKQIEERHPVLKKISALIIDRKKEIPDT